MEQEVPPIISNLVSIHDATTAVCSNTQREQTGEEGTALVAPSCSSGL